MAKAHDDHKKKEKEEEKEATKVQEDVREGKEEKSEDIASKGQGQNNEELKAQLQRALADYQNLQRRVEDERIAISKFATQYLILELLPIVDNLEQAVGTAPEEEKKSVWFQAVQMSVGQLKDLLKKEGIEEIAPTDLQFDPHEHEAIDSVPGQEDNKVVDVLQKGYKLHGKVIRAAKVRVSKRS